MQAPEKGWIWSIIAIIALLLTIVYHLSVVLQVRYQLVADFLPQSIIWEICKTHLIILFSTLLMVIVVVIFHVKKRYKFVVGITAIILISQELYLFLSKN